MRATPRRVVLREFALCLLTLIIGLIPVFVTAIPESPALHPAVGIAWALWATLLVPARKRWPRATLLATTTLFISVNQFAGVLAVPLIGFSVARRISPARRLWLLVLLTTALDVVLGALFNPMGGNLPVHLELLGNAANVGLLLVAPCVTGALLGRRRPLVRILRERNEYLERAQALTSAKARTDERAHIASEMHDMLGHRLSLISMHAGALEVTAAKNAPELSAQAELLRTTAGTAMTELREILGVLRGSTGDPEALTDCSGTKGDVANLVAESRQADIDVELTWSGPDLDSVDRRTRHAVHRLVREGLTNVHKHASTARAEVEVTCGDEHIQVTVTNGAPQEARAGLPGTRSGLIALEERISLLGGTLTSGPLPDGGFRVTALLPPHPTAAPSPRFDADQPEPTEPLAAEAITVPRALGAGCLGVLVVVPILSAVLVLAIALALRWPG